MVVRDPSTKVLEVLTLLFELLRGGSLHEHLPVLAIQVLVQLEGLCTFTDKILYQTGLEVPVERGDGRACRASDTIHLCLGCALRKLQVLLHGIEQALSRGLIQILKVDIDSSPLPCD